MHKSSKIKKYLIFSQIILIKRLEVIDCPKFFFNQNQLPTKFKIKEKNTNEAT